MLALDGERLLVDEAGVGAVDAHHERAVGVLPGTAVLVRPGALPRLKQAADAQAARAGAPCDGTAEVIAIGDNREVARVKVPEDALLGGGVVLHGLVPIEVVWRDVQQHGHVGVQLARAGQLEARELSHEPLARRAVRHLADGHAADVSHGLGRQAARAQKVAREGGRGGLAVGARDAHPALGALAPRELGLAEDGVARRVGAPVEVAELGDAGARDARVVVALHLLGATDHADAGTLELLGDGTGLALGAAVQHDRAHAPALDEAGHVAGDGVARLAQAQDQHVTVCARP